MCLNAFRSCFVITWSTISNAMFSLKWTEGMIHSVSGHNGVSWAVYADMSRCHSNQGPAHPAAGRHYEGRRGVRRDGQPSGSMGTWGEGRSLTKRPDLIPGAVYLEKQRSPTLHSEIQCTWPSEPLTAPGHLLKHRNTPSSHDRNSDADRSKPLKWCQRLPVGMEWVTMEAHDVPGPWAWILLRHRLRAWAVMSPSLSSKTDPLPFRARGMNKGEHRIYI